MAVSIESLKLSAEAQAYVSGLEKRLADSEAQRAGEVKEVFTSKRGWVSVRFSGSGEFPTTTLTARRMKAFLGFLGTDAGQKTVLACIERASASEESYKPDREAKAKREGNGTAKTPDVNSTTESDVLAELRAKLGIK